jgi:uncharacterized cupin superfamily protein
VANLFDPDFAEPTHRRGFEVRRAKLGEAAGSERLGASLYELEPGSAPFAFHYHAVFFLRDAAEFWEGEEPLPPPEDE